MKTKFIKHIVFLFLFFGATVSVSAQEVPFRKEFLNYWNHFKNALKSNDAEFLFGTMETPFVGEGSYYNPEAEMDEIKENYQLIYPPYLHEMEFVRFDAIIVEGQNAYIWLGYSVEDDAYFYCYQKIAADEESIARTMSEKWWFKKKGNDFKLFRTTLDFD